MLKKLLKSIAIITSLGLIIILSVLIFNTTNSQAASSSIKISASDLKDVGFTNFKALKPIANGRYQGPNLYFLINNKNISPKFKTYNIVMIDNLLLPYTPSKGALFNYGLDNHNFQIPNGIGEEATMVDGRTAINFIKGHHYIVVMGPDQVKIETLSLALANKIQ